MAVLIGSKEPKRIADAINNLLVNDVLYKRLKQNCLKAREELNWQEEEKKLVSIYQSIFTV